jgi:prepilin-type N-terminal cleavage/methylation domain-containing protein
MTLSTHHHRRGMTLVELLVVVAIIGLLAVSVAPLTQTRSSRRKLSAAADLVAAHCSAAVAKSIGSPYGAGIWLQPDATGSGGGQAVTALAFSRPRVPTAGTATITAIHLASPPPTATLSPALTLSSQDAAMLSANGTAIISFAGIPQSYNLVSTSQIAMPLNCSAENASFPGLNTTLPYRLELAPRRKASVGAAILAGDACIDLSASTLGVHGYSVTNTIVSLNGFQAIAVQFDGVGRPSVVWLQSSQGSWQRRDLQANLPVALLIGNRSQIGLNLASTVTEDDPGPNMQNPDAVWAVIDPRSAVVRTVDNRPATSIATAQSFVAEALANQVYQK